MDPSSSTFSTTTSRIRTNSSPRSLHIQNVISSLPPSPPINQNSLPRSARSLLPFFLSHIDLQLGDLPLLTAARAEARNNFRKNASLRPEDPAVAPAIAHAEEVAKILKENIVQGKHEGDDMYSEFFLLSNRFISYRKTGDRR